MDLHRNAGNFPILKAGLAISLMVIIGFKFVIIPYSARLRYERSAEEADQIYEMTQKQKKGWLVKEIAPPSSVDQKSN